MVKGSRTERPGLPVLIRITADSPGRNGLAFSSSARNPIRTGTRLDDMDIVAGSVIRRQQTEHPAGTGAQPLHFAMVNHVRTVQIVGKA